MEHNDPARVAAVKEALRAIALPDICRDVDVAQGLHLTIQEARKLIADEAIPGRWMGGRWYTTRWALMRYIAPSEPMA
jgi:hypothetical protein